MEWNSPAHEAKDRTVQVREELAVAGAELHLTNTALEQGLPSDAKKGDVRKALDHNSKVEARVNEAAEELEEVTELLEEEIRQRRELERKLARRNGAAPH
jgi:hypothetical protein